MSIATEILAHGGAPASETAIALLRNIEKMTESRASRSGGSRYADSVEAVGTKKGGERQGLRPAEAASMVPALAPIRAHPLASKILLSVSGVQGQLRGISQVPGDAWSFED